MISACHHAVNELLSSFARLFFFFPLRNAPIRSLCEPLAGSFFIVCWVCLYVSMTERE